MTENAVPMPKVPTNLDRTDYVGSCHRCECVRKRHHYRSDPVTGDLDLIRCLNCNDCPEFVHHPGWEPMKRGTAVRLPDGQYAAVQSYDPSQDAYWVGLGNVPFYVASHHLRPMT